MTPRTPNTSLAAAHAALLVWLLLAALTSALPPRLAAAGGDGASAAPAVGNCLDRAVTAIQRRYEGVRDISARFEQRTQAAALGAAPGPSSVSRGHVVLAKPGKMRWVYEEPEKSLVVSDGETLWIYDPTLREAQRLPMTRGFSSGAAAQFLLGAGNLRRDFEISAVSCGPEAARLELVPREPASYEKIFLLADPKTGAVRSSRVVDLLGNVSVIEFRDVQQNLDPGPEVFRFEPPAGVKIIELER